MRSSTRLVVTFFAATSCLVQVGQALSPEEQILMDLVNEDRQEQAVATAAEETFADEAHTNAAMDILAGDDVGQVNEAQKSEAHTQPNMGKSAALPAKGAVSFDVESMPQVEALPQNSLPHSEGGLTGGMAQIDVQGGAMQNEDSSAAPMVEDSGMNMVRDELNAIRQSLNDIQSRAGAADTLKAAEPNVGRSSDEGAVAPAVAVPSIESEQNVKGAFKPQMGTVESYGVLTAANGGLSENVWQQVARERAETLLERLKENDIQSFTGKKLAEKLLMTQATPPAGNSTGGQNWLAVRVEALQAMGFTSSVHDMLKEFTGEGLKSYPELVQLWTQSMLLGEDTNEVCRFVRQQVLVEENAFWRHALLVCQAVQKDAGLQLSIELVDAKERRSNPVLYQILDAIVAEQKTPLVFVEDVKFSPLQAALLAAYPPLLSPETVAKLPDIALRKVAHTPASDDTLVAIKGVAAEKLLNNFRRVEDVESLTQVYASVPFASSVFNSAIEQAKTQKTGFKARALLWQAAGAADLPSARALLLRELWQRAEADGLTGLPAMLTPDLRNIAPEENLAWFAPYAIKAALRGDNLILASQWWDVLSRKTKLQHDLAAEKVELAVAFGIVNHAVPNQVLQAWWNNNPLNSLEKKLQAQRLLTLIEAYDLPVAPELWLQLHNKFSDANTPHGKGPGALWLRVLGTALEQNNVGEAVLLLIEPLFYTPAVAMPPQSLGNMVTGLNYLGFENEAMALTMEALMAQPSADDKAQQTETDN